MAHDNLTIIHKLYACHFYIHLVFRWQQMNDGISAVKYLNVKFHNGNISECNIARLVWTVCFCTAGTKYDTAIEIENEIERIVMYVQSSGKFSYSFSLPDTETQHHVVIMFYFHTQNITRIWILGVNSISAGVCMANIFGQLFRRLIKYDYLYVMCAFQLKWCVCVCACFVDDSMTP